MAKGIKDKVVIIGMGCSKFGERWDKEADNLMVEAYTEAIADAGIDTKQIDAAADRQITFPLGPSNKGEMKGDDYLNHFVLPNFYFHLTTAYAILRHCGVDIGKRDFLGAIPIEIT